MALTAKNTDTSPPYETIVSDIYQQLIERSPRTYRAWQDNFRRFANGVGNRWGFTHALPMVASKAKGGRIWDEDGNEFIDCMLSQESLLLGNSPECVVQALHDAIDQKGLAFGVVSSQESVLAELIAEHYPSVEKLAFCTTGGEANHCALRLARAFTGRNKIAKFEGSFHGCLEFFQGGMKYYPNGTPNPIDDPIYTSESAGMLPAAIDNTVVLPFNHPAAFDKIRRHAGELAAVIMEPLQNCSCCPTEIDFMRELRAVTRDAGVLLIFDEVITGFKMTLGGGQGYYGIKPDLTTFGKALGAGLPLSAVGGRADVIKRMEGRMGPDVVVYGGTHAAHPVVLAGAIAALRYLAEHPEIYTRIDQFFVQFRDELNQFCLDNKIKAAVHGYGFMSKLHFVDGDYHGVREMSRQDPKASEVMALLLRLHGLHTASGALVILGAETTEADLRRIIEVHKIALRSLRSYGLV